MKFVYFLLFSFSFLFCVDDCESIYAEKKAQIQYEYEKLEHAKAEFEAYKSSVLAMFSQKNAFLDERSAEINATLELISQKEANILAIYERNEKLLYELSTLGTNKIQETYSKMKDGSAAAIMTELPRIEAARILFQLTPKKIASILPKMDAKISAELTQLLKRKELFSDLNATNSDTNSTQN